MNNLALGEWCAWPGTGVEGAEEPGNDGVLFTERLQKKKKKHQGLQIQQRKKPGMNPLVRINTIMV